MIPHSRPTLGREERKACERVLSTLQLAQGRQVERFERMFARATGRRYAVAVSSGTAALQLSLIALGVRSGQEVLVPSYACAALLHAVDALKARPVPVDIDFDDFNISPIQARKRIRKKTGALIAAHLFGRPARMEEMADLGPPVIEDGTQALGAAIGKRPVGSFGILSVFSFYATKMMTTGEGGMVATDDSRLAGRIRDMRDYDKKNAYRFRMNAKMTELEAAIGIEQMKKLPFFVRRRREIAAAYDRAFAQSRTMIPSPTGPRHHSYYRYVVRIPSRVNDFVRGMGRRGIDIGRPVFKPIHRYLGRPDREFPETSLAMRQACSIPIYPSLTRNELKRICDSIRDHA